MKNPPYILHADKKMNEEELEKIRNLFRGSLESPSVVILEQGCKLTQLGNTSPLVYLSGTITKDPKHIVWRQEAEKKLEQFGMEALSPIRGKDPKDWVKNGLNGETYTTYANGGFVPRDRRDIERSDAMLLYFMDSLDRQSIGSWVEFGWADFLGLPVVVCSDLPEVIEHPFVYRLAANICPTLDESIEYLKFLLL